jgi:hypothetical protein
MDVWNLIAERKIREAMDEGAFDLLEGQGKPLSLEENPYEDPAQRMAHRILRNNGFAPAWILEGKDIDFDVQRLRADRERLTETEYQRRAAELNRRIASFNLKTPVALAQKPLI